MKRFIAACATLASICLLVLPAVAIHAQTTGPVNTVETGTINGAPFHIELPKVWNNGLVMVAHGYRTVSSPQPDPNRPRARAMRDVFISRGFAVAESGYSVQGWAVKEGIEDTEALRRYFVSKYGVPKETYITGDSMGGHITMATIERYPDVYQGAMPTCGPLGSALDFMTSGPFDMLVTFEALFPGSIGSPYEPGGDTTSKVKAAIAAQPEVAASYAGRYARRLTDLPGVLGFWHEIVRELKHRAGGEPFDNRNRIYVGFGDDVRLNRSVKRYTANPAARDYLRSYATPTGRISDPILTLHTTYDQLVLGTDVTAYEIPAAVTGTSHLFVARFVEADGHCNFTPAQMGTLFDSLLTWAREGRRPAAGEQN